MIFVITGVMSSRRQFGFDFGVSPHGLSAGILKLLGNAKRMLAKHCHCQTAFDFARLFGIAGMLSMVTMSDALANSFYMGGVCYSDPAVIVEVFESHFPVVDGAANDLDYTGFNTTVSATGLMTYQINEQNLKTGAITLGGINTVQLMDCTAKNNYVATGKVDRTLIVLAVVFATLFGFNVGRKFFSDKFGGGAV